MKRIAIVLLVLTLTLCFAAGCGKLSDRDTPPEETTTPAPEETTTPLHPRSV